MSDTLLFVQGSTDWAGGKAPAGGTHTGTATITMKDGLIFLVAANRAEVLRKISTYTQVAGPSNPPQWVAFDVPASPIPVTLDITQVVTVV